MDDEAASLAVPGSSIARQVLWLAGPVLIEQSLLYLVGLSGHPADGTLPFTGSISPR